MLNFRSLNENPQSCLLPLSPLRLLMLAHCDCDCSTVSTLSKHVLENFKRKENMRCPPPKDLCIVVLAGMMFTTEILVPQWSEVFNR